MPRISTKHLKIRNGDIDESLEIQVNYSTDLGFYAEIPEKLTESFDQMDDDVIKRRNGYRKYNRKYATRNEPHKRVVTGTTEDGLVKNMTDMLTHLMKQTMVKEPVIIITFQSDDREGDRHKDKEELDPNNLEEIGLGFSAKYCHRVTTGTGKPKYYQYSEDEWQGRKRTIREEVHVDQHWNSDDRVIPDTPDNRAFLEDLHRALRALVGKMRAFTKTPESVQKMIQDRQKLLTA